MDDVEYPYYYSYKVGDDRYEVGIHETYGEYETKSFRNGVFQDTDCFETLKEVREGIARSKMWNEHRQPILQKSRETHDKIRAVQDNVLVAYGSLYAILKKTTSSAVSYVSHEDCPVGSVLAEEIEKGGKKGFTCLVCGLDPDKRVLVVTSAADGIGNFIDRKHVNENFIKEIATDSEEFDSIEMD